MELNFIKKSIQTRKEKKFAIFSVCTDNNYVVYAITTLLSFKKHYPDTDLLLFGNFKIETLDLIRSCGVIPHKIDFSDIFKMFPGSSYPSECFWWLGIPDKLKDRGYQFSMYVDGDVISLKQIPEEIIESVIGISGSGRKTIEKMVVYSDNLRMKKNNSSKSIIDILKLNIQEVMTFREDNGKGTRRINSSVMLFNHNWCKEYGLFDKSKQLIRKILDQGEYWNGDDSFISLLAMEYPELPIGYITNLHNNGDSDSGDNYIYHFNGSKPWKNVDEEYVREWQSNIHINARHFFDFLIVNMNINKMYWYNGFLNFGDVIGPWLFRKKRNQDPIFSHSSDTERSFYTVGSIVSQIRENGIVWGSGISNLKTTPYSKKNLSVKSVRGPLTRKRLTDLKVFCPDVYGDPGLLLPKYYYPIVEKKYKLGIIPHYVDYEALKNSNIEAEGVLIINLNTSDIEHVVDEILSCEKTLSSSLHGIIVSAAYEVPTYWVKFSDKIYGDNAKFWDFYLSLQPKETHPDLINRALNKIKDPNCEDELLDEYSFKNLDPEQLDYNTLIQLPKLFKVENWLIKDILTSCPFQ